MEPKPIAHVSLIELNCTHFWHPTDEQWRLIHISSNNILPLDCEQSLFFFRFSKGSAHARESWARNVPVPSRAFSHARGHLRVSGVLRSLFCRLSSCNLYIRPLPSTVLNDFISLWFPRDFRNTLFIVRATPLVFSLVVPPRVSHLKEISFFLKENRHPFSLKNTRKVNIPYPCLRQTSKFHLQASYLVCINEVIFFASLPGQRRL